MSKFSVFNESPLDVHMLHGIMTISDLKKAASIFAHDLTPLLLRVDGYDMTIPKTGELVKQFDKFAIVFRTRHEPYDSSMTVTGKLVNDWSIIDDRLLLMEVNYDTRPAALYSNFTAIHDDGKMILVPKEMVRTVNSGIR